MTKEQLGELVLSEFGLDKSEIKVGKDHVEGNPSALTLRKFITGKRISVYDIKVVNQRNDKVIRIRIRLFKLLLIPMMFPIISWFFGNLSIGLIAYVFAVAFFGFNSLLELRMDKKRIERKIKTHANNGYSK